MKISFSYNERLSQQVVTSQERRGWDLMGNIPEAQAWAELSLSLSFLQSGFLFTNGCTSHQWLIGKSQRFSLLTLLSRQPLLLTCGLYRCLNFLLYKLGVGATHGKTAIPRAEHLALFLDYHL